jgi:hypothetical protein
MWWFAKVLEGLMEPFACYLRQRRIRTASKGEGRTSPCSATQPGSTAPRRALRPAHTKRTSISAWDQVEEPQAWMLAVLGRRPLKAPRAHEGRSSTSRSSHCCAVAYVQVSGLEVVSRKRAHLI